MKIINDINLPDFVFEMVKLNTYEGNKYDYSTTGILDSPRMIIGKKIMRTMENLTVNVSSLMYMFMGTIIHAALENRMSLLKKSLKLEGIIQEKRIVTEFNIKGKIVTFSGEPDLEDRNLSEIFSDRNQSRLIDYKTLIASGYKMRHTKMDKYTKQLNTYNMLSAKMNNYTYQSLWDCWVIQDWRMYNTNQLNYPSAPLIMEEVKLMDVGRVEAFISKKLSKIESLLTDDLETFKKIPYCNATNRWQDPPIYKVYKLNKDGKDPKTIRAIKNGNCTSEEAAIMLKASKSKPDEYAIKYYKSEPKRCIKFCELHSCGLCNAVQQWKDGNL